MESAYIRKKIEWIFRKRLRIYSKKTYAEKPVLSLEQANDVIARKLIQAEPFCVLRFGFAECRFIESQLTGSDRRKRRHWKHSGFSNGMGECFQTFEESKEYVQMVLKHCGEADIMAYWPELEMEDYIIQKYAPQSTTIRARYLEPIGSINPWTQYLKNKKVLIINPFVKDIERQYARIDNVFPVDNPWPAMELKTLKSIWYPGKDFTSWFDALDFLYNSAMKQDFDVALLSCGPFGFDLAARFKEAGKQAIHIGGALQMLFGIMGSRWDNNETYKKYVNEYWIRAPKDEMPENAEELDQACYW